MKDVCVVFIHGFMGNSALFAPFAEAVAACGAEVRLLTLPGHGGTLREFLRAGRREWQAHVDTELAALQAQQKTLLVVGHSMGGLLAVNVAAKRPDRIVGIFALAFPLYLRMTWVGIRIRTASACRERPGEDPRIVAARELRGRVWRYALERARADPELARPAAPDGADTEKPAAPRADACSCEFNRG